MNEPMPPPAGAPPSPPKTSPLSIWSLVLGILSLVGCTLFAAVPGVICGHKALGKIKRSNGALEGKGMAIAGLVTGYLSVFLAFTMVPLMLAIAIPNFVRARDTAMHNVCVNNMRLIDSAKQQWALEHHKANTETPTWNDLRPYLPNQIGAPPVCLKGGTYTIGTVGEKPACSIHGQLE
jgi:hypothetical protein